ncbi:unnamed protein product [Ceutorhynchus assimilis]|uniref:Uncharacterized protein n=1 Tax=Ceutorhynchus assimilis TaxID=467358 RepID=A0A9N9MKX0_9CUCU|nr:unnamed protein product [Ceutorhynchus assimilis]
MGEPTTINEMYKLLQGDNQKQTELLTGKILKSENNIKLQIKKSNQKLEILKENQIVLERKIRRNNIIFFGFKSANQRTLIQDVIAKLNDIFSLKIILTDINNIYRLGKGDDAPVLIEFISFLKKSEIFENPEKLRSLKNTQYAISNDLCEEDRKTQKILRKHLKQAKEENKVAKIRGLRLEINNTLYTVEELEQLSESETEASSSDESDSSQTTEQGQKIHNSRQNKNKRKNKKSPGGVKTRSNKKKKH